MGPMSIDSIFAAQLEKFGEIRRSTAAERIARLRKLEANVLSRRKDVEAALWKDLRKGAPETAISELYPVLTEIKHSARHLKGWMKPVRAKNPISFFGARARVTYEPRGVVLVLAPWNFPFQLALGPVVSAISAGNCVILKPSEVSAATSALLKELIHETFPENEVAVVEGGPDVASALLDKPFHHIFFTGSPAIGKVVMKAASQHLASVTLELGGKSPVILDESCDLKSCAEKIIWGKLLNAGQACVAPDYLLVPQAKQSEFIQHATAAIKKLYDNPEASQDYCRIISDKHHQRIRHLIQDAIERGAIATTGGTWEESTRFIAPTILTNVKEGSAILEEEIFGPVLPVIPYRDAGEAISLINRKERPLALYIFSKSGEFVRNITQSISAGGVCVNDVVVHYVDVELPFGGINNSGFGNTHGFYGFRAFSQERGFLKQAPVASMRFLYPPYTEKVKKLIELTLKYF